jgi:RNase H-fold protein (predicted Holliday junction resolvase)
MLLKSQRCKKHNTEPIDSQAAALILSDYLERKYARK